MERWWARHKIEKGATAAPFYLTGEVSLPFLAGLLLPALGFLCHCLLSPPSCGFFCASALRIDAVAAAWHAHPIPVARRSVAPPRCLYFEKMLLSSAQR